MGCGKIFAVLVIIVASMLIVAIIVGGYVADDIKQTAQIQLTTPTPDTVSQGSKDDYFGMQLILIGFGIIAFAILIPPLARAVFALLTRPEVWLVIGLLVGGWFVLSVTGAPPDPETVKQELHYEYMNNLTDSAESVSKFAIFWQSAVTILLFVGLLVLVVVGLTLVFKHPHGVAKAAGNIAYGTTGVLAVIITLVIIIVLFPLWYVAGTFVSEKRGGSLATAILSSPNRVYHDWFIDLRMRESGDQTAEDYYESTG